MIITSNDGIDIHGNIIYDDHKIIDGSTVTATDDKVIQFRILKDDIAFDDIFNHRGPMIRRAKAHHRPFGFRKVFIPAGAVITRLVSRFHGFCAHLFNRIRTAGAIIGLAGVN